MAVRASALVVMLTLAAPPLVGIVCGFLCETESHHQVASAPHHGEGHGTHHAPGDGLAIGGEHVCDHGLGVVDVFGPSSGQRASHPPVTVAVLPAVPAPAALHLAATPWDQPLERVLGPPTRSPVLRI